MVKFHTLDDDTKEPLYPYAKKFRAWGIDELGQRQNVRDGQMSMRGHRGLLVHEHNAIVDENQYSKAARYLFVVTREKPGQFSTYSIYCHTHPDLDPNETDIRVDMDHKDLLDGSALFDIGVLVSYLAVAASGRAINGYTGPGAV